MSPAFLRQHRAIDIEGYATRTHDSLKISNGKWCWFSQGIVGKSALDYLIKVRGFSFAAEVEQIMGKAASKPPVFMPKSDILKPKTLLLLKANPNNIRVVDYLQSRGIDSLLYPHRPDL